MPVDMEEEDPPTTTTTLTKVEIRAGTRKEEEVITKEEEATTKEEEATTRVEEATTRVAIIKGEDIKADRPTTKGVGNTINTAMATTDTSRATLAVVALIVAPAVQPVQPACSAVAVCDVIPHFFIDITDALTCLLILQND
jgi:hypothetical protein